MLEELRVFDVKETIDGERVTFSTKLQGAVKTGHVSRSALLELDGGAGRKPVDIFFANEAKIARAIQDHLLRNPNLLTVEIGSNHFK